MDRPQIGQKAPDFKGIDQDGKPIGLSDFKGKKVILYFYPKDNTPGCTVQSCNLRDHNELLQEKGYQVLGVSKDSPKSHQKFISNFKLNFPLIADTDTKIAEAYGVWGEKKFMGRKYIGMHRVTFVIDEEGTIADVIEKVETKNHTAQILK